MHPRHLIAHIAGKSSLRLLRTIGSGATALPGLVTLTIDPNYVARKSKNLRSIVITGTNGKTTTANELASILSQAGLSVVHNASGSNLMRGIASTLLEVRHNEWAIFECDEADFPNIVRASKPKIVVMLNLFRDQMDRYAEINTTIKKWNNALDECESGTRFIINGDDPALAWLGMGLQNKFSDICFFGIDDKNVGAHSLSHAADSIISPLSGSKLHYRSVFISHLGDYNDPKSNFKRPQLTYKIGNIKLHGLRGADFTVESEKDNLLSFASNMPGLFNVYNSGAAAIIAASIEVDSQAITSAIANFKPVFGRFEEVVFPNGKKLVLFLIKNPTGFDQIIHLLNHDTTKKTLMIAINDNLADGTDISWLWDVEVESLKNIKRIYCSGTRAHDMALRLKYGNVKSEDLIIHNDFAHIIQKFIESDSDYVLYGLVTYTAMLQIRAQLAKQKLVDPFHKER